jgi:hypothetical protein
MQLSGTIEEWSVPQLTQLKNFMNGFHGALKAQRIEGIPPFKGYEVSNEEGANAQLWKDVSRELTKSLLKIRGNVDDIRVEPPFILGLKALLQVLGNKWAEESK